MTVQQPSAFFPDRVAFSEDVEWAPFSLLSWRVKVIEYRTAIFLQVNTDIQRVHHDALEFADGTCVLLTDLLDGQAATVLQLPAQPKTPAEKQPRGASRRWASVRRSRAVEIVGGSSARCSAQRGRALALIWRVEMKAQVAKAGPCDRGEGSGIRSPKANALRGNSAPTRF